MLLIKFALTQMLKPEGAVDNHLMFTIEDAETRCGVKPLGREKGTHEAGEIPWIIGFVVTKEQNGDKLLLLSGPEGGLTVKTQTHAKAPSLTVPLSSGPPRTQTFCRQTTPVPFQPNSPGLIHKVHTLIFADNTPPPIPLGRRHEEKGGRELGHPKSPPLRCRHPPAGDKKSRRKKGEGRK
ncbi:hypothetical protein MG293_002533 [Ovis ammon polii]|uniref:Uncharacterized protein n=1 Tax=Ovis ammon polii TaxID=230172 RepID=A0AAD4UGV6_OVIAM|nr:hypothetical protein MG293_002533 [Ovis ammon polii]KAI4576231.1 hypothetical protein MJT46_002066 [Ovis ammon polii x Ovis aries]